MAKVSCKALCTTIMTNMTNSLPKNGRTLSKSLRKLRPPKQKPFNSLPRPGLMMLLILSVLSKMRYYFFCLQQSKDANNPFLSQLNNLKTHAGIETMLLTMRGTTDMPLRAVAFATDGVEHFLKGTMKTDTQDFLGKMEGFAVQGMKGINISSKHFMLLSIILEAASEKTISSYSYLFLSYPQNKRYK